MLFSASVRSTEPIAPPLDVHWAAVTFCWRVLLIEVRVLLFKTSASVTLGARARWRLVPVDKPAQAAFARMSDRLERASRPSGEHGRSIFRHGAKEAPQLLPDTADALEPG